MSYESEVYSSALVLDKPQRSELIEIAHKADVEVAELCELCKELAESLEGLMALATAEEWALHDTEKSALAKYKQLIEPTKRV